MRRAGRIALWVLGVLLALPVVLVAGVLIGANTGAGQRLIAREIGAATGGTVRLSGLHGTFPQALRLHHLALADAQGVWLSADDVVLDWAPLALLHGTAHVRTLSASEFAMARLPVAQPAKTPPPASSKPFQLPVRVVLDRLDVPRAALGAAVAGAAITFRATGQGDLASLTQGRADLTIQRLDAPGYYAVALSGALNGAVQAGITVREPAHGFLGALAHLPALGGVSLSAHAAGPRNAERIDLDLAAGALRASLRGSADLAAQTAALDISAQSPAMQPAPGIAWQAIDIVAHSTGPWQAPQASGHVAITGITVPGAALQSLTAELRGTRQEANLHGVLTGLHIPGPKPDVFAAPLEVTAHADLAASPQRVLFSLRHALLRADGTAILGGTPRAALHLVVPQLAPLAALGGVQVDGTLDAQLGATRSGAATQVTLAADADITGGMAPLPALLGKTHIQAAMSQAPGTLTVTSLTLQGRVIQASLHGTKTDRLDAAARITLPDLAALAPRAAGALTLDASLSGRLPDLAAAVDISGTAGGGAIRRGAVRATLRAQGLPAAPAGTLQADAMVDGAPLKIAASATRAADGALHAVIDTARWKTVSLNADLTRAPGAALTDGPVRLAVGDLNDFSALTGQALRGSLTAAIVTHAQRAVTDVTVQGAGLGTAGDRIARLRLAGRVTGTDANPDLDVTVAAEGIEAGTITGNAHASARGRAAALALSASADAAGLPGGAATASLTALLDAPAHRLAVQGLRGDMKGLALRLQAPVTLDFGAETKISALRLALNQASLMLAGRVAPTLDVSARLRNVTPDLAKPFLPALDLAGSASADAHITGTQAAPAGTIHVAGSGFKPRGGIAAFLPGGGFTADAALGGGVARVALRADVGPKLHVRAAGTLPIAAGAVLALRASGTADLTVLNPVLQATGRTAAGRLAFDVSAAGSAAYPVLSGGGTLTGGEIQDYTQGVHLTQMAARVQADGGVLRIVSFRAAAAPGTIAAEGSIGLAAPMAVDLHLTAANAKPLASDLVTARLDADLALRGALQGTLDATGRLTLRQVDITIPDSLPPSVAVLHVQRPGSAPPKPAAPAANAPPSVVRLAVEVQAAQGIFVRGHGLNAELGGTLHVRGNATAPQIGGGFTLRRGDFSLAGTTLNFDKGDVSFNGTGVAGRIDPTLDFEADSTQGGITATLKITGYADAPKISLSSVPDLPQDEVLAHLLFGTSVKNLSPFQIAAIGAALAEISGVTGGADPLNSLRKGLGLDRLSVGGGTNGAGASVQAGRYVAPGVYVGAKQAAGGAGGTQAQVQVDLTKRLKLTTTLGTGGGTVQGATPENDPGSSVGLAYQFEY